MIKYLKKKSWIGLIAVLTLFPVVFAGSYFEISKNLEIFASLFKELNTYYVKDVEPGKLMHKGIDAMLSSLDPYTNYISESEVEGYRFQTTGKYGGIGARIQKQDDYVVVVEPYVGYPAYNAGLRAGDKIAEIDGESAKGKNSEQVSNILRGSPGTAVEVTVLRPPLDKSITVEIEREEIKISSVPYAGMINDSVGYIRLINFTQKCGKDVKNALQELEAAHPLAGIILDLRNNPGGLLNEAVNVANVFIEKGEEIVSTKGKISEWDKTYRTLDKAIAPEVPVAILVNGNSASASEIVAGSVQDLDRGVVIGQQTFGKGLVQTTRKLAYDAQLKVTTAKYYIPSGRCIQSVKYGEADKEGDEEAHLFETRNGRKVVDSEGIAPDVETTPRKPSNITAILMGKNLIFDYATRYSNERDSIAPPRAFNISDEEYEAFKDFLKDKAYDYTTKTEELIAKLEESTQKEQYYDAIEKDLKALEQKLKHDKEQDLNKFKEEIKQFLEDEIVSRYYFQKGSIEASFDHDKDIQAAIAVMGDKSRYNSILQPKE